MRTILIQPDVRGADLSGEILTSNLKDFHIALSIDDVKLINVQVVIIWLSVPNFINQLPNLKLILTCGSGVDHIINSPSLPINIPNVRLVDPFLQNHVSNYVTDRIFEYLRIDRYSTNKKQTENTDKYPIKQIKIGIMGLGLIGSFTAKKLISNGFTVCGWVNSKKERSIDEVYIGRKELANFAVECNIIVCLLPLTKETNGILNSELFNKFSSETYLINVGRGEHLVEPDLLLAISNSKISGACLDVFVGGALPTNHEFISNYKIKTTPHIAGYISPETQAPHAAEIILDFYNNKEMHGVVNYLAFY